MSNKSNRNPAAKSGSRSTFNFRLVLIVLFVSALMIIGFVSLTDTDPTISEYENRALKSYPEFSFEALFDGSFFTEVEEAYNDTFPWREFWMRTNTSLKNFLLLNSSSGILLQTEVSNVEDGAEEDEAYLEYLEKLKEEQSAAEAHAAESIPETSASITPELEWGEFDVSGYEQFLNGTQLSGMLVNNLHAMQIFNGSAAEAEAYVNSMHDLRLAFPEQNIISIVAPCSSAYYADGAYVESNHNQGDWLELVRKNMPGISCPDIYSALEEHKDEYIYFKTDHHWTALGAYYAYIAAMKELGLEPVDISTLEEVEVGGFWGTLYNSSSDSRLTDGSDTVHYYIPSVATDAECYSDRTNLSYSHKIDVVATTTLLNTYACFLTGDNPLTIIKTDAGTGRSCIVLKNSFGNSFVPWLCHNYDSIYVIDPRHVNTTSHNKLWPAEYFEGVEIDDIYVCFNTLMAGTSTLTQGMERLTVEGAYDNYIRYVNSKIYAQPDKQEPENTPAPEPEPPPEPAPDPEPIPEPEPALGSGESP